MSPISGKLDAGWRWLDQRLGLEAIGYPVPVHANGILYTLGGITLFALLMQVATGVYLSQFYNPDPASARDTIIYVVTRVSFGEFARGLHFWLANLIVMTMGLHALRVFFTAAYKRPREINWLIGVGLFLTTTALFFTGTVLKWDQEAYEALKHNEAAANLLGGFGTLATTDFTRSISLLTRFYPVHTSILPILFVLLIVGHLALVKYHGISPLPQRGKAAPEGAGHDDLSGGAVSFFNLHLRELIGYGMLLGAVAAVLALAFPARLGPVVIPGLEVTKPPWPFWWLYAFETWWGLGALLWLTIAVPLVLAVVPFVDRTRMRHVLDRRGIVIVAVIAIAGWAALTLYVWVTPTAQHLGMSMGG